MLALRTMNGIRKVLAASLLLLSVATTSAQTDSLERRYAATITEADLRAKLEVLASDSFGGRETGELGQRLAAAYIRDQFQDYGIPPVPNALQRGLLANGYEQRVPLEVTRLGGLSMEVDGKPYTFLEDYIYFSEALRTGMEATEVMVLTPVSLGGTKLGGGSTVVMLLDDGKADRGSSPRAWADQAVKALEGTGTRVLLMVEDDAKALMERWGGRLSHGRMQLADEEREEPNVGEPGLQVVIITPEVAQFILDHAHLSMKKALRTASRKRVIIKVPLRFTYASRDKRLTAVNVLGFVEGSDKKNEIIVVTAHYDHVGIQNGEVYNGADDDGSGTVAVLEMAQAFAQAKAEGHGPLRSMLFMTVSGEEKGLLGSQWYTDHPVFPLDSTVANLNIDMIGRTDTVHGDSSSYVYVIGSKRISTELGTIIEQENATWTRLDLDYTFDAADDPNRFYYRSDHYNFAKHGVPIAFFFNGVHADYHGPYDEVDKIRFDLLHQRTLLVFHTGWELANRDARITVDHPVREEE